MAAGSLPLQECTACTANAVQQCSAASGGVSQQTLWFPKAEVVFLQVQSPLGLQ